MALKQNLNSTQAPDGSAYVVLTDGAGNIVNSNTWSFASIAGGLTTTADQLIVAAAGAGIRNYLTGITIQNASATISTEVVIKDGSTVIWRGFVGTSALLNSAVGVTFPSPLRSTANTALNVACITTASQVYVNAQGYQAA